MFKEIVKRGLKGFMIEVFITDIISILISLSINNGEINLFVKELTNICKSPINAYIMQFFVVGIMGFVFGALTIIWDMDDWSILKQTVIHFLCTTPCVLLAAYICRWMQHTFMGFLLWIGIAIVTYVIIWAICYLSYKIKVNEINKKLENK